MGCKEVEGELDAFRKSNWKRISKYSELNTIKSGIAITSAWLCISFSIFLAESFELWPLKILAVIVISAKQHSLYILMHEGVHKRLARRDLINELVSDFFTAFPLLISTKLYRFRHLKHHKNLNNGMDPDFIDLPDWKYPMSSKKFLKFNFKYLLGYGVVDAIWSIRTFSGLTFQGFCLQNRISRGYWSFQLLFYFFTFLLVSHFNLWNMFFAYWLVPLFVIFPFWLRIRNISEHYGVPQKNEFNSTRNIISPTLTERFFVGPLNVSYHLDHHLFPAIPFYNLPKVHRVLFDSSDVYRKQSHICLTYFSSKEKSLIKEVINE